MPIAPCTPDDIHKAMQRFDVEMRDTAQWHDWEEDKNNKFALVADSKRYPMKQIISIATGTPTTDFSGGEESIRFANKLDLPIEALRVPSEPEVEVALHELLLSRYPDSVEPKVAYDALGEHFHLSKSQRSLQLPTDGRNQWENRVQWARNGLAQKGILDNRERGVWSLKPREAPKTWLEKCILKGRQDRETGPDALGKALWSPTRDARGADVYRNMRLIEAGDIVLHLIDNDRIVGISLAAGRADPNFVGLNGTDWADRKCYRIELKDYERLSPEIHRTDFFQSPARREQLKAVLGDHDNLFYNQKMELNQGAYLTEVPSDLLEVVNDIYLQRANRDLPKLSVAPRKSAVFLEDRLKASILLFKWIYGDDGFASSRYLKEERDYKFKLANEWNALVTDPSLSEAILGSSPEEIANKVGSLLTKTNLLPWRYGDAVKSFRDAEAARTFDVFCTID